jgi:hypothetical protein
MGQITSLFARKVIQQVDQSLDKRALLDSIGIDPDSPINQSHMVQDSDCYSFLLKDRKDRPQCSGSATEDWCIDALR